MINFIIILFIITLIYLTKAEMVKSYVQLMVIQGVLLFGLAYLELNEVKIVQLIFILIETLVFKAIFVPIFLYRITKNQPRKNQSNPITGYYSVFIAVVIIITSFISAQLMHEEVLDVKYFTAATSSILIGLFVAFNNRDLVTHFVSYLVIENGIFLLSLALGSEMPMFVNSAILLDIFTSVLIMGIFFNRLRSHFQHTDISRLSNLKD